LFFGDGHLATIYKRLGISKRNEYSAPCRYTVKAEGYYTQDFCKLQKSGFKKYVCRSEDFENHFLNAKVHRSVKKKLTTKRAQPLILALKRFFPDSSGNIKRVLKLPKRQCNKRNPKKKSFT
jgi:hypothetical protein